jgi:hypothetical protein
MKKYTEEEFADLMEAFMEKHFRGIKTTEAQVAAGFAIITKRLNEIVDEIEKLKIK